MRRVLKQRHLLLLFLSLVLCVTDCGLCLTTIIIIIYSLTARVVGRTTDDFATSFLHFPLFSTAIWDLANSRPVHSLMLSSHLFLCLPCLLPPFTVPSKMVLARPDERETWPYHCSLRLTWQQCQRLTCQIWTGCKNEAMRVILVTTWTHRLRSC